MADELSISSPEPAVALRSRPSQELIRRIAVSATSLTAGATVVLLAAGLATSVISSRLLAPQGRGEFLAVYTWSGVVGLLLNGGASHALTTYVRRGLPEGQVKGFIVRHVGVAVVGGGAAACVLLTGRLIGWFGVWHAVGGILNTLAFVLVADLIGVSQGYGDVRRRLNRVRVLPSVVGLTTMLVLVVVGDRSPGHWLVAIGAAQLAVSIEELWRLGLNPQPRLPGIESVGFRAVLGTAWRFYPIGVAAQVNYRLDLLMVSMVLPRAAVANYGVAAAAGVAVASIGQAVGLVHFGKFAAPEARSAARASVWHAAWLAAAFSTAIALPLAAGVPFIVRSLYGSQYSSAISPAQVLVLAAIPLSIDFLLLQAFMGLQHRLRHVYVSQAVTATLTIIGVVVASRTSSLPLVAMVSPVAYSSSVALLLWFSRSLETA